MPYSDNFWHIDAHENIPSPAPTILHYAAVQYIKIQIITKMSSGNNTSLSIRLHKIKQQNTTIISHAHFYPPQS